MRKIISLLLILLLVGCQFFEKKNTSQENNKMEVAPDTLSKYEKSYPKSIEKYIVDRQAWFLEEPNENSNRQNLIQYGYKVEIKGEQGNYYKAMNYKTGNYAYIPKSKVGSWEQISLIDSDLNKINFIQKGEADEPDYFEEPIALNSFIHFELIDQSLYEKAKKSAVDFLLRDTLAIVKKNHELVLPCLDSIVTFKDINPNSDSDEEPKYSYKGQIQALNSFLIFGNYWEHYDYKLIDKKTGKEVSFTDFPYLSPDKKYIISAYANPYDETEELSLYAVDEHLHIKPIFTAYFTNWMAHNQDEKDAFWSKDGYFYVPVSHKAKFWNELEINNNYQYIRIKIL